MLVLNCTLNYLLFVIKRLITPIYSKMFLVLVVANVFLQFDVSESLFNSLIGKSTQNGSLASSTAQPVCGTNLFWAEAEIPSSSLISQITQLTHSNFSGKIKSVAVASSAYLFITENNPSLATATSEYYSKQIHLNHSGLSPPFKI